MIDGGEGDDFLEIGELANERSDWNNAVSGGLQGRGYGSLASDYIVDGGDGDDTIVVNDVFSSGLQIDGGEGVDTVKMSNPDRIYGR